jgi:histidyl-tRNA synthetase
MESKPEGLIEPRTLKGFRDFLPEMMMPREAIIEIARRVYRSFGFAPIDTPTLELFEILAGKGSDEADRQMYHFRDQGDRHVGMRFDLTVPLARFVAQHAGELGFPFKRYHIATVWRGESPQAGRYREFMQCDFDTIGSESIASDIETALVIFDLFRAIGFDRFGIRINNRKVLNGVLNKLGLAEKSNVVLRTIDKLGKQGRDAVSNELTKVSGASTEQVNAILHLTDLSGSNAEVLSTLTRLADGNDLASQGVDELRRIISAAAAVGIGDTYLKIDPSIARGLDYYTGTIFETLLTDLPGIGSVCSGGRYDNLAGTFTKQHLPGIGASLGLDRLLAAMEQLKMLPGVKTPAEVLIVQFDSNDLPRYLQLAKAIRNKGIGVEVFPDAKKLGQQFKYADRRGFSAVISAGPDELRSGKIQIKWLADGEKHELPLDEDATEITNWLIERLGKRQN